MDKQLIHQFMNHPHKPWIVAGTAFLAALLFALPAWDDLSAARTELSELHEELDDAKLSIANLAPMRQRVKQVKLKATQSGAMDADTAEEFREQLVRMAFKLDCHTRRVALSEPQFRPWHEGDDPLKPESTHNEEKSEFQLETRKLDISVSGSLAKLSKLVTGLSGLNQFAVPTNMTLQREGENGKLRLDVSVSLLNLVANND